MKKLYALIVLLSFSGAVMARTDYNKLNVATRMVLNDYKELQKAPYSAMSAGDEATVNILVRLSKGTDASDINWPRSFEITGEFGRVVTASIAVSDLEKLENIKEIVSVSLSQLMSPQMNKARPAGKVDDVQNGNGLEQPFDGAGVVVGMMDTGIDPNHINFMNSDLTASRVKEVYSFMGSNGVPTAAAVTPEEVSLFTTDNTNESHGTHVAGIMTGSYKGKGNYIVGRDVTEGNIPYWGVAPESDIVMTAGNLYDVNILAGIEKIIDYAKGQGKPAVVNLSLGSIVGPHDGSSNLSEAMATLGEDGIICISSGNDGDKACAVNLGTFSALRGTYYTGVPVFSESNSNIIEFWGDTSTGFDLDFILYDPLTRSIVTTVTLASDNEREVQIGGSGTNYTKDDNFSAMFSEKSYWRMQNGIDPANSRFYVYVNCDLVKAGSSNLVPGVKVYNKASKSGMVYGYAKEGEFSDYSISTWKAGTANGSINDMATGDNVIAIGAFTSSASFSYLSNPSATYTYGQSQSAICSFSSYGPNVVTGVQLPVICAPGSALVSSVNNYQSSYTDANTSALVFANSRSNRWAPMQGTSMACPFASGVVALWLQADPSLTVTDVTDIMKKTAIVDNYVKEGPAEQWGAGKLDALAGIKEVLERKNAGVQGVLADVADELIITPVDGRVWEISVASASAITARLYNMQGIPVVSKTVNDSQLKLDASHVAPGVYVLAVETPNTDRMTRRLLVK